MLVSLVGNQPTVKVYDLNATEGVGKVTDKESAAEAPVYSIDGRYVGKYGALDSFDTGIYICNGRKFMVR